MYAIGLMSGTSLDGIDAVLCKIEGVDRETKVEQIAFETYDLSDELKAKIQLCCQNKASTELICSLNFELGYIMARAAQKIALRGNISTSELAFIASHGQTIYHIPNDKEQMVSSTLQIGEPSVIANICQCPVISNFRSKDMAVGGQGAPLVPFSEYVLYGNKNESIALQNIGGIGNVTILPKNGMLDDVFAFDTGPGNMMIDEAMRQLFSREYDDNGNIASQGQIIESLRSELLCHPYLKENPPKTTGREVFGKQYVDKILIKYSDRKKEDIIHTLTWFTAFTIADSYRRFIFPKTNLDKVIVGGGGAHNNMLMNLLSEMLPSSKVLTQEKLGYSSDAKEAIAFVILGNQTLHNLASNVPAATGAYKRVILGSITQPN